MKLEKRTRAILVGAFVLLGVIVALPSRRVSVEPPAAAPAEPVVPAEDGEETVDRAKLVAQQRRAQELTWTRDPFAAAPADLRAVAPTSTSPSSVPEEPASVPVLTGICVSGGDRLAVIDRRIVREKELLPTGYTVVRIGGRTVDLLREDEELVLSLGEKR